MLGGLQLDSPYHRNKEDRRPESLNLADHQQQNHVGHQLVGVSRTSMLGGRPLDSPYHKKHAGRPRVSLAWMLGDRQLDSQCQWKKEGRQGEGWIHKYHLQAAQRNHAGRQRQRVGRASMLGDRQLVSLYHRKNGGRQREDLKLEDHLWNR